MKVICPKCQFENQADSTRVVCARCATIIEVRVDQGSNSAGFDANGKRQTARLPFAANSSNSGSLSNGNYANGNSGSLNNPPQNRDAYATRVGDDFDDVLDIPRQPQNDFVNNTAEATPVFEDVFSTNYDSSANYDFSAYDKQTATPSKAYPQEGANQRVTQDYTAPAEPEFMGWPVLPENNVDEEEEVVGQSSGRGGIILRVGLIVAAFGVLSFLAYYFLWDFIAKRKETGKEIANTPGMMNNKEGGKQVAENKNPPMTDNTPIIKPKPAEGPDNGKEVVIPPKTEPKPEGRTGQAETPKPVTKEPMENMGIPAAPNRGNLTLQVGSFPDRGQADERVSKLKAAGVESRVIRADIPNKGTWFRVQVGGFPSREAAGDYGNKLRSKGVVTDFIVTTIGK